MTKIEKAKKIVKEHKKEIAIAGITVVTGGVLFMLTKKKPNVEGWKPLQGMLFPEMTKLELTDSLLGIGVEEVSGPGEWYDIWLGSTPLSELGKLGEELQNAYGWKPEQYVGGVVSIGMELTDVTEI